MWLVATHYLDHEGDEVKIGFAPDQRIYIESLGRHEAVINQMLSDCLGQNAKIKMEVREDLEPIGIEQEEEPAPPAHTESPPFDTGAPPVEIPEESAKEESPLLEPAEMPDDFYDDPLINEAVDLFDAKIKK